MTPTGVGQTPRGRVAETVAADLRQRILSGTVMTHLPTQDHLVREFGVSHPSVREALRILETEGLITTRRGSVGGAKVHRPDQASAAYHLGLVFQGAGVTLGDLAQGLLRLEPQCAGDVARRPDRMAAVVPVLTANVDASAEAVSDGVAFTRIAREFHDLVVAFTPNETTRYVVRSLVALWSAQEQQWAEVISSHGQYPSPAAARGAVRTHRRLVEEIAAGRADEVERLGRRHLAATQALVLGRFADDVVEAAPARAARVTRVGSAPRPGPA
ncbi:FadR/GntR family transcriptional regulator [Mycobacterium sp. AT1]|uniref:FadR/GntR family transcriptional regulator n=1 Tax=Mycobacterium sp. AT1 TaxID=1961706 RepID=UPI0009ACE804|nr:GntR family transcriptional regulator [Mycobacterium sp. AT1]OPX06565.1 GntR family transcriptional regulator [Mycobacterium sp. AT1]